MRRHALFLAVAAAVALTATAPLLAATFDDGKLEVSWFDGNAVFKEADEIDYLWVREGFDLAGKTLVFKPWGAPKFLGPKASERDEKDLQLAKNMNSDMHGVFERAFERAYGDKIKTASSGGNVRVEGRIVDCSTGSTAAKVLVGFGAGSGNTTIDVRFVDVASGKVMAGFHHRVVSGSSWSTTDGKFFDWVEEATEEMAKKGLAKLYEKGKKVKD